MSSTGGIAAPASHRTSLAPPQLSQHMSASLEFQSQSGRFANISVVVFWPRAAYHASEAAMVAGLPAKLQWEESDCWSRSYCLQHQ